MSQRRLQTSKTTDRKQLPISRNVISRDRMSVPTRIPPTILAEVLMVAGGGSSGNKRSGGAGAGGLLYFGANTNLTNANGSSRGVNGPEFLANVGITYTITVGGGGTNGSRGSNTTITSAQFGEFARAIGGGGNGEGVGGSGYADSVTANTDSQGNRGGNAGRSLTDPYNGGGGAGSVGGNQSGGGNGGPGGFGLLLGDFSGYGTDASNSPAPSTGKGFFAGGGGGGAHGSVGGASGGVGGGGYSGKPGIGGLTNTGGGAGGGNDLEESPAVPNVNQNGGSGIALIAYPGEQIALGGTVDTTSRPGWTIHAFTSTGTFVVTG